ncbi:hypothetical protein [Hymenobacter sp. BRD67]|uniref:hypothetical protein n=1 Tax=Hymenobacter sp. BRD67 TaxID=2675877 RepID=UPI001563844F|nr:hypothetical protein [Hymenobacter sp. BRD67]QKG52481.1 hypothetical protein GKZ67_07530 [Hymenobacter sp. BRD67]
MAHTLPFFRVALLLAVVGNFLTAHAQGVGIGGTPNAYAALDIISTTKGLLLPRQTNAQMLALSPVAGLLVYNTDLAGFYGYQAVKAASSISQTAASSTSGVSLNQLQYSGSVSQTFTAVATGVDYVTVYAFLTGFGIGSASSGSVALLQATFTIKNAVGTVLGSANGSFPVSTDSTPITLNFPSYGLVVGQTYTLTVTRQDNGTAGFALYYSPANPYSGGALSGYTGADLKFQLGSNGHTAGWALLVN